MKKVCIITCYFDPDYVRSRSLRAGLMANKDIESIIIKNKHKGLLRYPEVLVKIILVRIREHPDIYILTFRGQEILPFTLLFVWPKKLIFDEFIVPLAWAKQEGHRNTARTRIFKILSQISAPFYRLWLKQCKYILTDTDVHARESARLSQVPYEKYKVIPVSTDETIFKPRTTKSNPADKFKVFFYGLKMTPLHGLQYILKTAEIIGKENPKIEFTIVGGDEVTSMEVQQAKTNGANVIYKKWIEFEDLPKFIDESDLCLGGPFGNTPQAKQVITGKTYQFLAMGVPTITGQIEEKTQLIDKANCLIVPQANPELLADKIKWAYAHPEELKKIGKAGQATYEKFFSNEEVKKILGEVVSSKV